MGNHASFYYPIPASKFKFMSRRQRVYCGFINRKIKNMISTMPECVLYENITDAKGKSYRRTPMLLVCEVRLNSYPSLATIKYDTVFTDFKSFKMRIAKETDLNIPPNYLGKIKLLFKKHPNGFILCS